MRISRILATLALSVLPATAGTPDQASAVRQSYEKSMEAFSIKLRLAKGETERQRLLQEERPRPDEAATRMWRVIGSDLDKEWTLEPAAWFLRIASGLVDEDEEGVTRPAMRKEVSAVVGAVGKYHVKSRKLAPMCMGLVAAGDNESLNLLRRIEKENPDPKISGVAALGIAMMAKGMGDDPRVMRERLTMLRKAIIDSADVEVDGVSMAQLAEEELYIIMNLSKGQVAPDLEGVDSGGRPMKLSDHSGNVVLLVFWNSAGEGADGLIEWVSAMRKDERFAGKSFEVVGVNSDPREELRKMQAAGTVDWPNFSDPSNDLGKQYRVGVWPTAYVLGPERKIHYVGAMGTFAELTAAAVLDEN
ncbi:hypothetical protein HAHE_38920 [Haloferula helveola]|uniref:Thioredoxin domain-containing protein n=1 Tax=Haloferula helveola TaxID=490095 RepID=A0ABM7RHR8_9BACT|nr:hypothetical protein HAHE_38920 [Haloferula helveola]